MRVICASRKCHADRLQSVTERLSSVWHRQKTFEQHDRRRAYRTRREPLSLGSARGDTKGSGFSAGVATIIVLGPLALWLGHTGVERALLFGSLMVVLIVELLNSAIEAAVDRIGTKHHKLSGRAKDMGSAAVTFTLLLVITTRGLVLVDRFTI
jgi:diacylglycerol kinase (ATP)